MWGPLSPSPSAAPPLSHPRGDPPSPRLPCPAHPLGECARGQGGRPLLVRHVLPRSQRLEAVGLALTPRVGCWGVCSRSFSGASRPGVLSPDAAL